jgi:thiazole synthase
MMAADVLILGGGVIGLALAVTLTRQGACVRVLTTSNPGMASRAAAGMLAPESEAIPPGALRDFALASRARWPVWAAELEKLSGVAVGYWPSGILSLGAGPWGRAELTQKVPTLGPNIDGGQWYPHDGQVDPRLVMEALTQTCAALHIPIHTDIHVESLVRAAGGVTKVVTSQGEFSGGAYVLCAGSWSAQLLDLPVFPIKGQMLSLQMQTPLDCVLFGPGIYLVPRRDGRLIVGATQENLGFTQGTTAEGIAFLRQGAERILPETRTWEVLETWYGFRPATPDLEPILGPSALSNLWLATGHHRNGILLAPETAYRMADLISHRTTTDLAEFSYTRFYTTTT